MSQVPSGHVDRYRINVLYPLMHQTIPVLSNKMHIILLLVWNSAHGGQSLDQIAGGRVRSPCLIPIQSQPGLKLRE